MAKHGTDIPGFKGSLEDLAEAIGDLRYDALSELLSRLSHKLHEDAKADKAAERHRLSNILIEAAEGLRIPTFAIKRAWDLCEPYMRRQDSRMNGPSR